MVDSMAAEMAFLAVANDQHSADHMVTGVWVPAQARAALTDVRWERAGPVQPYVVQHSSAADASPSSPTKPAGLLSQAR